MSTDPTSVEPLSSVPSGLLRAAHHKPFRQLWVATIVAGFANWMNRLAVGWFVLDQTDSALLTTITYTAQSAPGLLIAPFGGAIADRVDRRYLLACAAAVESLVAVVLAFVAVDGIESVWPVVLLVALTGTVNSLKTPATQALIPDTVGANDAMNGIAIHSVGIRGIGVLGALSSGLLSRAVLDPGSSRAISSLVQIEEQCEIYLIALPPEWQGRRFDEMLPIAKESLDVLLVAVEPAGETLIVNPPGDYAFATGDRLAVIAEQRPEI